MTQPAVPADRSRAVVVGAGLAGLLAARALATHFREVVVVERAPRPGRLAPYAEPPADADGEILRADGCEALDRIFPGLCDALWAAGASRITLDPRGARRGAQSLARTAAAGTVLCVSRSLLEQRLRCRLEAMPNVGFLWQTPACGLRIDEQAHRVTAVRLLGSPRPHRADWLRCDLLVDAGGCAGLAARWLVEDGLPAPPCSRIGLGLRFTSRGFEQGLSCVAAPFARLNPDRQSGRGALLLPQEGRRGVLHLITAGDAPAPSDEQGFAALASGLRDPALRRRIAQGTLSGALCQHIHIASLRRHYERQHRPVGGLLALGDALCTLNPLHGYGPSLAAQQAAALADCLAERAGDPARRFQRRAAALLAPVWRIAAVLDLRLPGARPQGGPGLHRLRPLGCWLGCVQWAARHDPQLAGVHDAVVQLQAPLRRLLSPAVIGRVLRRLLRRFRVAGEADPLCASGDQA